VFEIEANLDGKNLEFVVNNDSDWAGDVGIQVTVTGFIIYLFGVPICWKSKGQKYVAMSETVKEIRFILYLLKDIRIPVNLCLMVKTDDIGEMFMAESASYGVRARHIDKRYHFIREHIEDVFIKIIFDKQKTMIPTCSPRMSIRIPTR
jgi:hypothetical protein